ncbi:hypothetical protein D1007_21337 [Hordeum vulgare]|nr:hypothetical protein D1007_21337 [Hordeum vulgare]
MTIRLLHPHGGDGYWLQHKFGPRRVAANAIAARLELFMEGTTLASAKCRMEAAQREYNCAYEFTPAADGPSRWGEVRGRGRVVADILGGKLPVHDTSTANMRAA